MYAQIEREIVEASYKNLVLLHFLDRLIKISDFALLGDVREKPNNAEHSTI